MLRCYAGYAATYATLTTKLRWLQDYADHEAVFVLSETYNWSTWTHFRKLNNLKNEFFYMSDEMKPLIKSRLSNLASLIFENHSVALWPF